MTSDAEFWREADRITAQGRAWAAAPPFHVCPECGRTFDLLDATDAAELAAGHDCEVTA